MILGLELMTIVYDSRLLHCETKTRKRLIVRGFQKRVKIIDTAPLAFQDLLDVIYSKQMNNTKRFY